jgi:hypothetical protein
MRSLEIHEPRGVVKDDKDSQRESARETGAGFEGEQRQREFGQPQRSGPSHPQSDSGGDANAGDEQSHTQKDQPERRSRAESPYGRRRIEREGAGVPGDQNENEK